MGASPSAVSSWHKCHGLDAVCSTGGLREDTATVMDLAPCCCSASADPSHWATVDPMPATGGGLQYESDPVSTAVGSSMSFLEGSNVKDSLPEELSQATIDVIQETAVDVISRAEEVADAFFRRMMGTDFAGVFNQYNQASRRQHQAFANVLVAFVAHIDRPNALGPTIDLIASKHCALGVQPEQYLKVMHLFVGAIEEVLGPLATLSVKKAWNEAIMFLSGMLIDREEELYNVARSRNGGWNGFRWLHVCRRRQETHNVTTFRLKPESTGVYFDFTPGQYVSLKVADKSGKLVSEVPRHYIVTSRPGFPYIEITVKKVQGGLVSTFLHEEVQKGHRLLVSPPFGVISQPVTVKVRARPKPTVVLVSAGIGVSAMIAYLQEMESRVLLACHVDKDEESHAFRERFLDSVGTCEFYYTRNRGRPAPDYVGSLTDIVGVDHDWYLCGPSGFMFDAVASLTEAGVDPVRVHFQLFGPQLSCPAACSVNSPVGALGSTSESCSLSSGDEALHQPRPSACIISLGEDPAVVHPRSGQARRQHEGLNLARPPALQSIASQVSTPSSSTEEICDTPSSVDGKPARMRTVAMEETPGSAYLATVLASVSAIPEVPGTNITSCTAPPPPGALPVLEPTDSTGDQMQQQTPSSIEEENSSR